MLALMVADTQMPFEKPKENFTKLTLVSLIIDFIVNESGSYRKLVMDGSVKLCKCAEAC